MIATHNIKVNGVWYRAGEEYQVEEPKVAGEPKAVEKAAIAEEKPVVTPDENQKEFPKTRTTTRRKVSK